MKVLMVSGSSVYVYQLSYALYLEGIKINMITSWEFHPKLFNPPFVVETILEEKDNYYKTIKKIKDYISKEKPDIVHLHSTFAPRLDWFFLPDLYKNLIYTAHNILPHEIAFGESFALKILYKRLSKIIVHGQRNKQELINNFGVSADKIHVIAHGAFTFYHQFSSGITKEEAKLKFGISSDKKVLLFFGIIRKIKGLNYLLMAYKEILKEFKNIYLIIAGPPFAVSIEKYRKLIYKLGIKEKVYFNPTFIPIEEVGLYFTAADIVVLPYIRITHSGVASTAISYGLPIVATDVGGLNEVVENSKNGFLVPPKDVFALKQAICKILMNEDMLKSMSEHSLRLANEKFNWQDIARKTIQVYKDAKNK